MEHIAHPPDHVILATLNGTSSRAEKRAVVEHIQTCSRCRATHDEYGRVLEGIAELALHPRAAQLRWTQRVQHWPFSYVARRKVFRASASVIAALVLVALGLQIAGIRSVNAGELLSRAESAEEEQKLVHHYYRVQVGGVDCTPETGPAYATRIVNDHCRPVQNVLTDAHWDTQSPLSIQSYKRWHDSLPWLHDSVQRDEPYWTIRTVTNQGALRAASLRLRTSNYAPVELKLEFVSMGPISIVEEDAALFRAQTRRKETPALEAQPRTNPMDESEVNAWTTLHRLGADSGWEATVLRRGDDVQVVGLVPDAHRREELQTAFAKIEGVNTFLSAVRSGLTAPDGFLAHRPPTGNSAPVAEDLLEEKFPEAGERGDYVTALSNTLRAIVGHAFEYEKLTRRHSALSGCSCAGALAFITKEQSEQLAKETAELRALLAPFTDARELSVDHRPLTYQEAQALDAKVQNLFIATDGSPVLGTERTIQQVASLLSKK